MLILLWISNFYYYDSEMANSNSLSIWSYDMTMGWILAEDRNVMANGEDMMADEVEKPDRMDEGRWYK